MYYDWNFWVMEWGYTSFDHAHGYFHKKRGSLYPMFHVHLSRSLLFSSLIAMPSDVIFYTSFQMLFPFQGSSCKHARPLPASLLYTPLHWWITGCHIVQMMLLDTANIPTPLILVYHLCSDCTPRSSRSLELWYIEAIIFPFGLTFWGAV